MYSKRKAAVVSGIAVTLFSVTACGSNASKAASAGGDCMDKVLLVSQMSGALATNGKAAKAGATVAIDKVNKAGGVLGCKLELDIKDNGSDSSKDVTLAQAALAGGNDYLGMIIADFGAPTVIPISTSQKELLMAAFGGPGFAQPVSSAPYAFDSDPTGSYAAANVLKYAISQGHKKLALITDNTAFGGAVQKAAKTAIVAAGGQAVSIQGLPGDVVNTTPALTRARQSGADAIFLDLYGPAAGHVLDDLHASGWNVPVYGGQNAFATNLPELAAADALSNVVVSGPRVGIAPATGNGKSFLAALKAKGDKIDANLFTYAINSDDITLMAWAANGAKSTDPAKMAEWLQSHGSERVPGLIMSDSTGYSSTNHEIVPSESSLGIAKVAPPVDGQWPTLVSGS